MTTFLLDVILKTVPETTQATKFWEVNRSIIPFLTQYLRSHDQEDSLPHLYGLEQGLLYIDNP